jgi:UDP-N-acetylglucosamine 2-epimerase (non-hydrolysing)
MKIQIIVSARPNFVKAAPLFRAFEALGIAATLVHAGQHFEPAMSDVFFNDLGLPKPDRYLGISGGTHGDQTGRMIMAFESLYFETRPDWTVVLGDVNATLAATIAVRKAGGRVGHVEAGLRSFDMTMPEEINRRIVDSIADRLWPPSEDAVENLVKEGRARADICLVGNVMIDTLAAIEPAMEQSPILEELGLAANEYLLVSLHRPQNVDDLASLQACLSAFDELTDIAPVIFPVHPRTRLRIEEFGIRPKSPGVRLLPPIDYVGFGRLQKAARLVITDSGGVQEETTHNGVPCITLRPNTERPVTLTHGTNRLSTPQRLLMDARGVLENPPKKTPIPLWDGATARRIADDLVSLGG